MKTCPGFDGPCGVPISSRRRRCPDCKAEMHNAQRRDKYASEKPEREPAPRPEPHPVEGELVDYSTQSAQPGMRGDRFSTQYAPRPMRALDADPVVDYTQGGQQRPSLYEQPQRVHNGARSHDYTESLRRQAAEERLQNQTLDWGNLASVQAAHATVDFSARQQEPPRYDDLGRPMARPRNRSRNGLR